MKTSRTKQRNRFRAVRIPKPACFYLFVLACYVLVYLASFANAQERGNQGVDPMAAHYEAAQKAQSAGNLVQAQLEYKVFLAEALRRLASRRAEGGDLRRAIELLEQALELTPNDTELRLDYARACRSSGDLPKAKAAAENVLTLEPRNARARLELGRTLSQIGEEESATVQLETAVAVEPNFEDGYALAREYLKRKNPEGAAKIFAEMQAGLGDSSELHLEFGSAYAEAGFPERGIPEFEKALAKNDKIRGGHYSLGAAYVLGLGDVMQDKAETEFRKELQNYPDDPLSLYQLGSIEFSQHKLEAAEKDLTRAAKLDERNPDTQLLLGQIYNETGRATEAETALRKCVALTTNIARNHYQVQQAHYLLARILLQSRRSDEAKQEMKIAGELMKQNTSAMQGLTESTGGMESPEIAPPATTSISEGVKEADAFEHKIQDAVADSYNNLGAMAATAADFPSALGFFQQAAKWNPSLEGLDYNWGRAAFSAAEYRQAVGPLARYLDKHRDDLWVRAALGSSYFSIQHFREALKVLQPMEQTLEERPQLSYIYAVSQVRSGETDAGVKRLENLQKSNPEVALIPAALAEAYDGLGMSDKATQERAIAKALQDKQASTTALPKPN